jgi:pimeloyl-ACP methyl ester carboxylesterase
MTTWDEWRARAEMIRSGDMSVATYDLGPAEGMPLTFLHGYPSSSLDIDPVWRLLGDDWRLLALDFPGFGASDKPADHQYSVHAAADAVERMWQARDTPSTVLVAHDYGVSIGQELLARRADGALAADVSAVVWMNGGLYPDLHRPTVGQQMLLDPDHGAEVAAAVTEELFVGGIDVTWGSRRPLDEAEVGQIWASMDERGGVPLMHALLHYIADRRTHEARWRAALETAPIPAVFVWGDLDPVSGAHMIERVEERLPEQRIVRLADVGHWPLLEAPDVVAAEVSRLGRASRS